MPPIARHMGCRSRLSRGISTEFRGSWSRRHDGHVPDRVRLPAEQSDTFVALLLRQRPRSDVSSMADPNNELFFAEAYAVILIVDLIQEVWAAHNGESADAAFGWRVARQNMIRR